MGREDPGEEVKVFVFVFEDMVMLRSDDGR